MKAVLRRTEPSIRSERLVLGDVELDRDAHEVTVAGEIVELTGKEFDLLAYLVENAGIVVSRDQLLDRVWGMSYAGGTRMSTSTSPSPPQARTPRRRAHRPRRGCKAADRDSPSQAFLGDPRGRPAFARAGARHRRPARAPCGGAELR